MYAIRSYYGLNASLYAFEVLDPNVKFEFYKKDGDLVKVGDKIVKVSGNIRAMLSAESYNFV